MTADTLHQRNSERADAAPMDSYRALVKQLPVTLRPELNAKLAEWETLFPFERGVTQEFMRGVATFSPAALDALLRPMRKLESRMGVSQWSFSETSGSLENASLLARSAYYAEWREEVRSIYAAVDAAARASAPPAVARPRLVVAILPATLPYQRANLWQKWGDLGIELPLEGDAAQIAAMLLKGSSSVPNLLRQQGGGDISDLWLIDSGSSLRANADQPDLASSLSWPALGALRERVLAQVNTVPKNIEVTDQTLASVRNQSWDPWWPPELSDQPALRRFVIDLYLSGNGALVFCNSFVEWSASEAIRRARPRVLFARFGLRAKPKPFTGIAIFEDQQRISTLPEVDDPQGSAVDALVLARYILHATRRYPEGAQTAFLCVAETARSAYLVLPRACKAGWTNADKVTSEQIAQWLVHHLSAPIADCG
jgi:hypothetical protein